MVPPPPRARAQEGAGRGGAAAAAHPAAPTPPCVRRRHPAAAPPPPLVHRHGAAREDLLDLGELPLFVAERARAPGLEPALDAVEVEDVAAHAPRDAEAGVVRIARGVGLVLDAGLVQVVAADGARVCGRAGARRSAGGPGTAGCPRTAPPIQPRGPGRRERGRGGPRGHRARRPEVRPRAAQLACADGPRPHRHGVPLLDLEALAALGALGLGRLLLGHGLLRFHLVRHACCCPGGLLARDGGETKGCGGARAGAVACGERACRRRWAARRSAQERCNSPRSPGRGPGGKPGFNTRPPIAPRRAAFTRASAGRAARHPQRGAAPPAATVGELSTGAAAAAVWRDGQAHQEGARVRAQRRTNHRPHRRRR
jgi:hypothetical protein